MVRRWVSFWDGLFLGAMSNFRGVQGRIREPSHKNGRPNIFLGFPVEVWPMGNQWILSIFHPPPESCTLYTPENSHGNIKTTQFWKGESSSIHLHDFGLPCKIVRGVLTPFFDTFFFRLQQKSTNVKKTEKRKVISWRNGKVISWQLKEKRVNQLDKLNIIVPSKLTKPKPNHFFRLGFLTPRRWNGSLGAWCLKSAVAERFKLYWDACNRYAGSTYDTSPRVDTQDSFRFTSKRFNKNHGNCGRFAAGPIWRAEFWLFEWLRVCLLLVYTSIVSRVLDQ